MKRHLILLTVLALAGCTTGGRTVPPGSAPPPALENAGQPAQTPVAPPPVESAGPLTTATMGSYMDNQERDLRQIAHGTPMMVARIGDDIELHLRSDDLFEPRSLTLSGQGQNLLWRIAPLLRRYNHTVIFIDGYTDTTGGVAQNLIVSRKRAYTVGGALVKDGVTLARLHATGYGETDLKIPTVDNVAEPRNRRIEIRIEPKIQS